MLSWGMTSQGYFFTSHKARIDIEHFTEHYIILQQEQESSFSGMVKIENDLYGIYKCVLYNPVGNPVENVSNMAATIMEETSAYPALQSQEKPQIFCNTNEVPKLNSRKGLGCKAKMNTITWDWVT